MKLGAGENLSQEERDEVREIAKRVTQMADEDKEHRDKVSDGLEKLREIEEKLNQDDDEDDQFGLSPSRM